MSGKLGESRQHEIENEQLTFGESRWGGSHGGGTNSDAGDGRTRIAFTQINGPVRMVRTDRTLLVTAEIEAVTHDTCSRCLEPATMSVSVALEEEFTPKNADLMGSFRNRPLPEETEAPEAREAPEDGDWSHDPALFIDEQNYLDLSEVLGQALTGATRIAPLCSDACLGICPTCTVNRNEIQCTCAQSTTDPRWEALAGLVDKGAKFPS